MKLTLPFIIATLLASLGSPALCAERILLEWDFQKASDTLGWVLAEPIESLKCADGSLVAIPGKGITKLESPLFEITATPWQSVEIDMKTDVDGTGLIYFSNTTAEPYHGFRGGQVTTFDTRGDGQYHTYQVHPFWQSLGKITHIRIDPPGKSAAIRAIRLVESTTPEPSTATSWQFRGSREGWRPMTEAAEVETPAVGCKLRGARDAVFISPPLSLQAMDNLCATVRVASRGDQTILFRWATDQTFGLQSSPIALRGDGLVHSYTIELSQHTEWQGKILALGITPSDSASLQEIVLESVALANGPVGPPELVITDFGLRDTFARVGKKVGLIVDVRNDGGTEAESVAAIVTLPTEKGTHTLPLQRIPKLAPGETKRFEWTFDAKRPGRQLAVCRANALDYDAGQKSAYLQIYPALDKKVVSSLKYVPEPAPADTGQYLVGAYYYPGWPTYDKWQVLNDYPERRPVLGYYREGDPQVIDWQINWALSHGISYFIYDWYWSAGARFYEHAIHDALFKSRYGERFKFCLLWANHNAAKTSSEQDMINVTRFWIENYFNKPNYLKINGKNVMVIFSTGRFVEDMGSAAVRASFDKMRKMCEDAGVGGLYMVACTYPGKHIKDLEEQGYDALTGYNYPSAGNKNQKLAPYEWMVDAYNDWWGQIADAATIPYIPVCEPGWDARPWHGLESLVRTGKSPALWEKMLENAKAFVDDPKRKKPDGKKLVFLEAWNEFGEGDYIEPHREHGFEHLEAVRSVFAPKSKKPTIVTPQDIGMGPYDLKETPVKTQWDFSKPEDRSWYTQNTKDVSYESGTLRAESQNTDPIVYSPRVDIDASKVKSVEIKMRLDKGEDAQLFFVNRSTHMSEERSIHFKVVPDNEFHVYEIDLSKNPLWRGKIQMLRFDPTGAAGAKFEIAYVQLK